ncbi:LysR family transcriptional regulator [Actinokineospora bangkokensis]|uniref:LysR family transcriptional regulator n=1 Tax=Actinokineospora bangkokensis TaxID=1193682 RepID=UPI0009FEE5CE|nr:LysR family transcriptional regulator [Actinokineospora bangkokensis]
MELRTVRYFLALAEERHFGRAAERAHVAQPALSQQIKQLEAELGARLFERSTRRVEVTEAGQRFLRHARRVVDAVDRAVDDMAALAAGSVGRVSVGFVGTATYDVLPRLSHLVRTELPGVDLRVRGELLTPDLLDGLVAGEYDLVLVRPSPRALPAVRQEPLRSERLVAVLPAAHPLAGDDDLDLARLAGEAFVVHPSGDRSSMHRRVLDACAAAGFQPQVHEVGETATLAVLVAAGLGVALVPEPVRSLGLHGVRYVPLRDPLSIDLLLARSTERTSAAVDRVARLIRAATAGGTRDSVGGPTPPTEEQP